MKIWFALAGGLLCFILLGYGEQAYLQKSSTRLEHRLTRIETRLARHDWKAALHQLDTVEKTWKKTENWWALLTHHQEIDLVEQALTKAREAIESKSYPDARMELGTMRHFFKHIATREKLSWVNIF